MNLSKLFLLPWLFLASCGPPSGMDAGIDASDPEAGTPGVIVELGTGQSDWEDLPESGARTELIFGAQGGFHIWGRARFRGLNPDVTVSFSVVRLDDGVALHPTQMVRRYIADGVRRGLLDLGGGEFATDAELVVLDIGCAPDVVGRMLLWKTRVQERGTDRFQTATRVVTVVDELPSQQMCRPRG